MKLSELFKTPFKLKGGSILNLRGFSKRVVDKEISGNSTNDGWQMLINIIKSEFNATPHPTMFCENDTLVNIEDIEIGYPHSYRFLYKKSELPNPMSSFIAFKQFTWSGIEIGLSMDAGYVNSIGLTFTIDGKEYVTLINDGPA